MSDQDKREETILSNMGLVPYVVSQMESQLPPLMSFEDAKQCGYEGLIMAVDSYDERLSSFSTYAIMKIRAAIIKGEEAYGELTRAQRRRAASWDKARQEMALLDADVDEEIAEISRHFSVSVNKGRNWERYSRLEVVYLENCPDSQMRLLREDEARIGLSLEMQWESDELKRAISFLSPEEALVIFEIFYKEKSQNAIQKQYGIGKNYLREVKRRALAKLRQTLENGGRPLAVDEAEEKRQRAKEKRRKNAGNLKKTAETFLQTDSKFALH